MGGETRFFSSLASKRYKHYARFVLVWVLP